MRPRLASLLLIALTTAASASPRVSEQRVDVHVDAAAGTLTVVQEMVVQRDGGGPLLLRLDDSMTVTTAAVDLARVEQVDRLPGARGLATWRLDIPADGAATASVILQASGPLDEQNGLTIRDPDSAWFAQTGDASGVVVTLADDSDALLVAQGDTVADLGGRAFRSDGRRGPPALVVSRHERRDVPDRPRLAIWGADISDDRVHALGRESAAAWDSVAFALGASPGARLDVVVTARGREFVAPGLAVVSRDDLALPEALAATLRRAVAAEAFGSRGDAADALIDHVALHLAVEGPRPDVARALRIAAARRESVVGSGVGGAAPVRLLHALRSEAGDAGFRGALRDVVAAADPSWDALITAIGHRAQRSLGAELRSWQRNAPPGLSLGDVELAPSGGALRLRGTLRCDSDASDLRFGVPIVIEQLDGRSTTVVQCEAPETPFTLLPGELPLRVIVDPDLDVPRRLTDRERAPTLARAAAARPTLLHGPGLSEVARRLVPAAERPEPLGGALPDGDVVVVCAPATARELGLRTEGLDDAATEVVAAWTDDTHDHVRCVVSGPPERLAALAERSELVAYLPRIVLGPDGRMTDVSSGPVGISRSALPDVREIADPERVERTCERILGVTGQRELLESVAEELRLAGWSGVRRSTTTLSVRSRAEGTSLADAGGPVEGAVPLVASPATRGLVTGRFAADPDAALRGSVLVVDLPGTTSDPVAFARAIGEIARAGGALGLVLRTPPAGHDGLAKATRTPDDGEDPASGLAAAASARAGHADLPLPTWSAPAAWNPAGEIRMTVEWEESAIVSGVVVARLSAERKSRDVRPVVLLADADEPGSPTGAAALIEAASLLADRREMLARDVVIVVAGGARHGDRGLAHAVAELAIEPACVIRLGRVGDRAAAGCAVEGPERLSRIVGAAMDQSTVPPGAQALVPPPPPGVDVPVVRIASTDEAGPGAEPSAGKIGRVARGVALAAIALSSSR